MTCPSPPSRCRRGSRNPVGRSDRRVAFHLLTDPCGASGADRPTCDASDAGLDAPAIQHDARALASEVTLAAGNAKSSFSEIRTLAAGAVDRETEWRTRNRCPL